jgi:hypothetical protein
VAGRPGRLHQNALQPAVPLGGAAASTLAC